MTISMRFAKFRSVTKILTLLLFSYNMGMLQAGEISFIGPCDSEPILVTEFSLGPSANLGAITIQTLEKLSLPYQGSERGLNSIFNTPTDLDAMEIINDQEMNAHGWCHSLNAQAPEVYPHEVEVKGGDSILWWFGYAKYLNGQWITQCEPTHKRSPSQFCQ